MKQTQECYYCGRSKEYNNASMTIDHVIPRSRGGKGLENNTVPCCTKCNQLKRDLYLHEWIEQLWKHKFSISHASRTTVIAKAEALMATPDYIEKINKIVPS